jgi:hypothetical protein
VRSESAADVLVTFDAARSITVDAPADVAAKIEIAVPRGTLTVRDRAPLPGRPRVRVLVTTPSCAEIAAAGAGDVCLKGVHEEAVELVADGAGDLRAAGTAVRVRVEASGAGDVRAEELAAQTGHVDASGAGDVHVRAAAELTVALSGSGDVHVYGRPRDLHKDVTGTGKVVSEG